MDGLKVLSLKRFGARSLDYLWFTLLFELLLSPFGWSESLVIYFGWMVFIPIEGVMIARWGITPSKALFGLKVHSNDGSPIGIRRSIVRSTYVWIYGLWLCIPFLSLVAGMLAYNDYRTTGSTIWDRKTQFIVN